MSLKLEREVYACNSYVQSNDICKNCLRNIGFTSNTHTKWKKFSIDLKINKCEGYLEKNK